MLNKPKISYIDFRKYQVDILADFERRREAGERKFHYVSPPGSGKTLIGLELFLRLGEKALILSPTLAIQEQWIRACKTYTEVTDASFDPFSDVDLVSLTYQSLSVRNGESLHRNSLRIIKALESRKTIIFDECHHLTRFWAKVLKQMDTGDRYFIALTATFPEDGSEKERNNYLSLFDTVNYEIQLPPIIKEGYLAPYNDLVYIVSPTDSEGAIIREMCEPYRKLMDELDGSSDRETPQSWAYSRLECFRDARGIAVPFTMLYKKRQDFCVALCRFVLSRKLELPYSVLFSGEMEEPPSFTDILMVMADYIHFYLRPFSENSYYRRALRAFRKMGYELRPEGFRVLPDNIQQILGNSAGKVRALLPVLEREIAHMGDDLRCLILCDQEFSDSGCDARKVFAYLAEEPALAPCRPILITGKTLLVHRDIVSDFLISAEVFLEKEKLPITLESIEQGKWYELYSDSIRWNSRISVPLVTAFLERGDTKCLVSTRALLGEGWNSITLNTLIDLTTVTSNAFVNQIRGRPLRLNDMQPYKTANNWDVVTVSAEHTEGGADMERLQKKYSRFFGLSMDGIIERGIGHTHPLLCYTDIAKIAAERIPFNTEMLNRAEDRLECYRKWKIREPYKNVFIQCLEIESADDIPPVPFCSKRRETESDTIPAVGTGKFIVRQLEEVSRKIRRRKFLLRLSMLPLLFAVILMFILIHPILKILFIILALVFATMWDDIRSSLNKVECKITMPSHYLRKRVTEQFEQEKDILRVFRILADVLFRAFYERGFTDSEKNKPQIQQRENGSYRIYTNDEKISALFALSLEEMLSPVTDKKYVLLMKYAAYFNSTRFIWIYNAYFSSGKGKRSTADYTENFCRLFTKYRKIMQFGLHAAIPVPSVFSKTRKDAEWFCSIWMRETANYTEVVGIRESGREDILKKTGKNRLLPIHVRRKELWE
ncbi:MAG: DEAD/DEAH box helicase family protein [Spirochaetaceae bacterium]|nr:DEAD/DEAH box helicase family protein [Spirochaetaceae bacterium]